MAESERRILNHKTVEKPSTDLDLGQRENGSDMARVTDSGSSTAVSDHKTFADLDPTEPPMEFTGTVDEVLNLYQFHTERFLLRFEESGEMDYLDRALRLFRQGLANVPADGGNYATLLNDFGTYLRIRYRIGGEESDIEEAMSVHRQAVELRPIPHPGRPVCFTCLASAHFTRFEKRGQQSDLEKAVLLNRQALELLSPHHPDMANTLNNLANALFTTFKQQGQRSDLDEAVSLLRRALELFPSSHPDRSACFNNLANALTARRGKIGQQTDLDEAILLHREALELRPPPHPLRPTSLNNLAATVWSRFEDENKPKDLDESIVLMRQALELFAPPHPLRSASLNNLAIALLTKFNLEGHRHHLDGAISFSREALGLRPLPHPLRPISLQTLANTLTAKFNQDGQERDLQESILLFRLSLEIRPPNHPDRSLIFRNTGIAFMKAYSLFPEKPHYLELALTSFCSAAVFSFQSPSQKFLGAKTWAHYADLHQHPSALDAHDAVFDILPQCLALSDNIETRHENLITVGADGLSRRAARCAINVGRFDKAIEFLESGRAIFWSQALRLRTPLEQLLDIAPQLGNRLQSIANALERASHRGTFSETLDNQAKMMVEEEVTRLERLNDEWLKAIDEARRLKGFQDFLLPHRFSSLQAAAAQRPVVMLVPNDDGSSCLIMTSTTVHHIAISNLPTGELRKLVDLVQAAASHSEISRSSITWVPVDRNHNATYPTAVKETLQSWMYQEEERGMRYAGQIPSDQVFEAVLKILWTEVVKPVIDFLDFKKSEEPPMLQWCPTGLFTFLPIHAAGHYNKKLVIDCASDYIISTYIPTIGVLLPPNLNNASTPSTSHKFEMMVVVDAQRLSFARRELERIKAHVPNESLVQLGIPDAPALVEEVLSHLPTSSIVHFACHGKQDRHKPLNSALLVEDGNLTISKIMQHPSPNGSLAFLCACETAVGDENLPDEAMSLGASMLFSGFRHVVATMWEMMDADGPFVVDAFYEELFRGTDGIPTQKPDPAKSARALHIAIKKLRGTDVSFRRWVPFIHLGN